MAIIASARRSLLVLSTLLSSGGILAASEDQPEFTYRTSVDEVRLSFSAMDEHNHGVATLDAHDLAVVDKGFVVRDFQTFTRWDWSKLEVAIVVDTSESVGPQFHQEIGQVIELFSQTAGIPDENVSLFSFHGMQPALICGGNCRTSRAADRLSADKASGLTPLFDSILLAADYLNRHAEVHSQKILVLFSDGEDTISRNTMSEAVQAAQAGDIQIECIAMRSQTGSPRGAAVLRGLANGTGGRTFAVHDGAANAANAILEGLRCTYTVTYQLPSRAAGFHLIRVLPTHNMNLQFYSRDGYYYPNRASVTGGL